MKGLHIILFAKTYRMYIESANLSIISRILLQTFIKEASKTFVCEFSITGT